MDRRPRLEDVAREAGVSKGTASRVLNADPSLSIRDATRDAVHAAAKRIGYVPHSGARALAGKATRALLFLTPSLDNPTHATIARGVQAGARERSYISFMVEDTEDPQLLLSLRMLVQEARVDGVIVGSARASHPITETLCDRALPHVYVNRAVRGSRRNVTFPFGRSSEIAVQHLLERGHRRIGHISGPLDIWPSRARTESFRAAVARHPDATAFVVASEFTEQGGSDSLASLRRADVTAVFTSSLAQGVGALKAAKAAGLRVPKDLALVANDELPLATHTTPALTTVENPLFEMGRAAAHALIDQLEGAALGDRLVDIAPVLIERQSSGGNQ